MTDLLSSVDGFLVDIDGVLMHGNEVLPGALDVIETLRARGIPHRYITNSTIYCRLTLIDRLQALGFKIEVDELFTATYAAAQYLRSQKAERSGIGDSIHRHDHNGHSGGLTRHMEPRHPHPHPATNTPQPQHHSRNRQTTRDRTGDPNHHLGRPLQPGR